MKRTGFTLTELGVCLLIIGILIAVLYPAISVVREHSKRVEQAQQKSISVGSPSSLVLTIETVEYEGHRWIIARQTDSGLSMIHHPNCPCNFQHVIERNVNE